MSRAKKGFTLIELLVVIAIIALLVSILLPSLHKAKRLAKKTVCLSQMRGIGLCVLMYADDNNDTLPMCKIVSSTYNTNYTLWYNLLSPYAGEATEDTYGSTASGTGMSDFAEIFKGCPEPLVRPDKAPGFWNSGYGMVVPINMETDNPKKEGGWYRNWIDLDAEKLGVSNGDYTPRFLKRSEFTDLSRRGWIADSNGHHLGGGPNTLGDPENFVYPTWSVNWWGNDPERHDGSTNIWFLDGHAKDYKYNIGGNAFYEVEKLQLN